MTKPKVMVAVLNMGWMHARVVRSVIDMIVGETRYGIVFNSATERPIENNRNHICYDFLVSDCNWLLMMDDDNPPLRNPLDLIERNVDIATCPTPAYNRGKLFWHVYKELSPYHFETMPRGTGFASVDAVSTGCILLSRAVVSDMRHCPPFVALYDECGRMTLGNDLNFCRVARERGFKVWVDWDYPCQHYSEVELHGLVVG